MRSFRHALLLLLSVLALHLSVAAPAVARDDYPWRRATATDAFGFTARQCVSFVAWRLAQRGTPIHNRQGWGDAGHWDEAARRLGHGVGSRPVVGAVAHWDAGERSALHTGGSSLRGTMWAGAYGHVAWVQHVHTDGSATVAQYNGAGSQSYSTARVKAPRYLYVGVQAPG